MLKWFADRLARTGKEVRKDQRGFTLIELLVVIIIIGILAAIAIPTFLAQRERSFDATAQSDLRNMSSAATTCAAANDGNYSTCTETELTNNFDFNPSGNVTYTVNPSTNTWSATATHNNATTTYTFNSSTGTITP